MSRPEIVRRRADWSPIPWKNGLGITHEIYRTPAEGDFLLRLSAALVASDAPFSAFPGIDRTLMLLEGQGAALVRDDGLEVPLREDVPVAFHGEDRWRARLAGGPVLDFNVMVDRARARANVLVCEGSWEAPASSSGLALLALEDGVTASGVALVRHDLAVFPEGTGAVPVSGRVVAVLWRQG